MSALIKEYISVVVREVLMEASLDATPAHKPSVMQQQQQQSKTTAKFSFQDLGKQSTQILMVEYAKKFLKPVGQGSSRIVFDLGSNWVLKVAKDEAGIAQNQEEAVVCSADPHQSLFTKVDLQRSDPNKRWLVSEFAARITNTNNWKQWTGITWAEFNSGMKGKFGNEKLAEYADQLEQQNQWFGFLIQVINECDYKPGDILKLNSWGATKDNRLVILDSGFTESVYQEFYKT